jgi:hypothetical protein
VLGDLFRQDCEIVILAQAIRQLRRVAVTLVEEFLTQGKNHLQLIGEILGLLAALVQAFVRAPQPCRGKRRTRFLEGARERPRVAASQPADREGRDSPANPAQHAHRCMQLGGMQLLAGEPTLLLEEPAKGAERSGAPFQPRMVEGLQQHFGVANGCQRARGIANQGIVAPVLGDADPLAQHPQRGARALQLFAHIVDGRIRAAALAQLLDGLVELSEQSAADQQRRVSGGSSPSHVSFHQLVGRETEWRPAAIAARVGDPVGQTPKYNEGGSARTISATPATPSAPSYRRRRQLLFQFTRRARN